MKWRNLFKITCSSSCIVPTSGSPSTTRATIVINAIFSLQTSNSLNESKLYKNKQIVFQFPNANYRFRFYFSPKLEWKIVVSNRFRIMKFNQKHTSHTFYSDSLKRLVRNLCFSSAYCFTFRKRLHVIAAVKTKTKVIRYYASFAKHMAALASPNQPKEKNINKNIICLIS